MVRKLFLAGIPLAVRGDMIQYPPEVVDALYQMKQGFDFQLPGHGERLGVRWNDYSGALIMAGMSEFRMPIRLRTVLDHMASNPAEWLVMREHDENGLYADVMCSLDDRKADGNKGDVEAEQDDMAVAAGEPITQGLRDACLQNLWTEEVTMRFFATNGWPRGVRSYRLTWEANRGMPVRLDHLPAEEVDKLTKRFKFETAEDGIIHNTLSLKFTNLDDPLQPFKPPKEGYVYWTFDMDLAGGGDVRVGFWEIQRIRDNWDVPASERSWFYTKQAHDAMKRFEKAYSFVEYQPGTASLDESGTGIVVQALKSLTLPLRRIQASGAPDDKTESGSNPPRLQVTQAMDLTIPAKDVQKAGFGPKDDEYDAYVLYEEQRPFDQQMSTFTPLPYLQGDTLTLIFAFTEETKTRLRIRVELKVSSGLRVNPLPADADGSPLANRHRGFIQPTPKRSFHNPYQFRLHRVLAAESSDLLAGITLRDPKAAGEGRLRVFVEWKEEDPDYIGGYRYESREVELGNFLVSR